LVLLLFYVLLFWCQLTQVVLEKRPLNECSLVVVMHKILFQLGDVTAFPGCLVIFRGGKEGRRREMGKDRGGWEGLPLSF